MNILSAVLSFLSKVFMPVMIFFAGKKSARADAQAEIIEQNKSRAETDEKVAKMSDDDLDAELSKFMRDGSK